MYNSCKKCPLTFLFCQHFFMYFLGCIIGNEISDTLSSYHQQAVTCNFHHSFVLISSLVEKYIFHKIHFWLIIDIIFPTVALTNNG